MQVPTFTYEQQYWHQNIQFVAGVDEAGMGALAGPVTAAAVMWDQQFSDPNSQISTVAIRDSKTLSSKQRDVAAVWIQQETIAWAVGEASVAEITELNIRGAAHLAMRRAIDSLSHIPDMLLLDGTPAQIHPTIPTENIINGDALSFSIAAASILAKVHRDATMKKLDAQFPDYGFAAHKGYGSKQHLVALQEYGACEYHRPTYAPVARVMPA